MKKRLVLLCLLFALISSPVYGEPSGAGCFRKTYFWKLLLYSVPAGRGTEGATSELSVAPESSAGKKIISTESFDREIGRLQARGKVKIVSSLFAPLRSEETLTACTYAFGDYPLAKGVDPKKAAKLLGQIASPYILEDGKVIFEVVKERADDSGVTLSFEGDVVVSLGRKEVAGRFHVKDLVDLVPGETALYRLGLSKDGKRQLFMAVGLGSER